MYCLHIYIKISNKSRVNYENNGYDTISFLIEEKLYVIKFIGKYISYDTSFLWFLYIEIFSFN